MSDQFNAIHYPADSAQRRRVQITVDQTGQLHFALDDQSQSVAFSALDISSRLGNTPRFLQLPDGSKLTLGPTSSVSYTELDTTRSIELSQGRAFFDVVSMTNKPFIVNSGVNTIEVTGTEFEVDVNNFKKTTRVSVVEGSVKVSGKGEAPE